MKVEGNSNRSWIDGEVQVNGNAYHLCLSRYLPIAELIYIKRKEKGTGRQGKGKDDVI